MLVPAAPSIAGDSSGEKWRELLEQSAARGDYAGALDYLDMIELGDPGNPSLPQARIQLLIGLGGRYYRERELSRARDTFIEVLDRDPVNVTALRMLGEIAYFSQSMDDAARYWQKALSLQPDDRELAGMLEKLEKEALVEEKLDRSTLANFDIRFHSRDTEYSVNDIQSYLLEAYQEIGYDFNYYPTRSIVVLLYTPEEFSQVRDAPHWVGALYDGKIRLPVDGKGEDVGEIKRILWHEYTHALINDETGNNCPRWLHEGLARYQESKVSPIEQGTGAEKLRPGHLIPLSQLDEALGFDQKSERVQLAYAEAYSLVDYLIRRYGFWRINRILEELKRGGGWKEIIEAEFLMPVSDLEKEWQDSL